MRFFAVFILLLQFLSAQSKNSVSTLRADHSVLQSGESFRVTFLLDVPEEWHAYYKNSGGIEKSPELKWNLPAGVTVQKEEWSFPEVKEPAFQLDETKPNQAFVYENSQCVIVTTLQVSDSFSGNVLDFSVNASWQICKASCRDEKAELKMSLPIASAAVEDAEFDALISNKMPKPSSLSITAERSNKNILLHASPAAGWKSAYFISDSPYIYSSQKQPLAVAENAATLTMDTASESMLGEKIAPENSLHGILQYEDATGVHHERIEVASLNAAVSKTDVNYWKIFYGMFLGGLILNLMPCVFPVIGLKILGFVQQAGGERKKIFMHGVLFTLGVVASFLLLSGLLYLAKSRSGANLEWGYQLQNAKVILALMMILFLFALSMYGVFEIGASATSIGGKLQQKQGLTGTFFSGVLATVVATPCSAPLLGPALGAAVNLPTAPFFMAFITLALGLSLPYLLLSAFPHLLDYLPRPGVWMESFKQALSFLLFASTGYLLWVYVEQIGVDHMLHPVFGLSMIGLAAWIYGRWNLPHKSKMVRGIACLLAIIVATCGIYFSAAIPKSIEWEKWSDAKVNELLEKNTPVYVDFTAAWCATCQANKKFAYTKEVLDLMHEKNIVMMKADKTKPDAAIDAKLAELKRSAIPVNVLYVPHKEPIITPEILTPNYLLDLIKREVP